VESALNFFSLFLNSDPPSFSWTPFASTKHIYIRFRLLIPKLSSFCNTMYPVVDLVFQFLFAPTRDRGILDSRRKLAPKNLTTRLEATFSSYSMVDTNLARVCATRSASTAGVRGKSSNLGYASLASFSRISRSKRARSACRMRISTADSKSRPGTGADES